MNDTHSQAPRYRWKVPAMIWGALVIVNLIIMTGGGEMNPDENNEIVSFILSFILFQTLGGLPAAALALIPRKGFSYKDRLIRMWLIINIILNVLYLVYVVYLIYIINQLFDQLFNW